MNQREVKCKLEMPAYSSAKFSKSRVSRLALISSLSKKRKRLLMTKQEQGLLLMFMQPKKKCEALKKLEIGSVKKKKNEGASRSKIKGCEVKGRVFDSLCPNKCLKEEKKLKGPSQIHEGGGSTDDNNSS